jgi:hypothetical protein
MGRLLWVSGPKYRRPTSGSLAVFRIVLVAARFLSAGSFQPDQAPAGHHPRRSAKSIGGCETTRPRNAKPRANRRTQTDVLNASCFIVFATG